MAFWHNCKLHSAQCNGGWIDFNAELTKNFCLCKLWRKFTTSRGSKNPEILQFLKVCHSINVTAVECYQLKKGQSIISSLSHTLEAYPLCL